MPTKPYPEVPYLQVFLNTSRDADSTTSLDSLFQCLTTLSVKKSFQISSLNLPWCSLRPVTLSLKKPDVVVLMYSCCIPILKEWPFRRGWGNRYTATLLPLWRSSMLRGPAYPSPAIAWKLQSVTKQVEWAKIQPSSMYEINWCWKISFFLGVRVIVMFPNPAISKLFNFHIMLIIVITLLYVMSRGKNEWEICSAWNHQTEVQSRHMSLCLH